MKNSGANRLNELLIIIIQGVESEHIVMSPQNINTEFDDIYNFILNTFENAPNQETPRFEIAQTLTFFLVKNWGELSNNQYLELNGSDQIDALYSPGEPGITAQGGNEGNVVNIPDPISIFDTHAITKVDNKYYDPSYGTEPQISFAKWEDKSLDAIEGVIFSITTTNNNGEDITTICFWVKQINTLETDQLSYN